MTGLEYTRTVCPTTKVGKDPLREDVADAFEDGIAEGWKQYKKKQWKPSKEQLDALHDAAVYVDKSMFPYPKGILMKLYKQIKKLREE